jgi:O-antigen ligase
MKYLWVALAGVLFSLLSSKIVTLDFRYALAIFVGFAVLSISMMGIYRIEDFLVYALIFNTPFSTFGKWLFVQHVPNAARGISVGLAEMLILEAYLFWFFQIFVARKESIPRLQKVDYLLLLLIFGQFISLIGAPDKLLGTFDIVYNIKHGLIYFFIAHKVRVRHLKWVVVLILFAILVESSLAFFERITGMASIGLSKGAVESAEFGEQYAVPGIEHELRAAGTTNDSHTLGLYYTMILPLPFVLMMMPFLSRPVRGALSAILILGIIGLIVTFSRSSWMGFAFAATFALGIILLLWKQGRAALIVVAIVLATVLLYPKIFGYVHTRLLEAPSEIMEARYQTNWTALNIWRHHFLFGYGPGNYMEALNDPGETVIGSEDLFVHNAFLWIAAELGLFGLITFFGTIFYAMSRCYKALKSESLLFRGLALAILSAFLGYLVEGLTNPLFRETVPYAQLWIYIGLSMSFERLQQENRKTTP